MGPPKQLTPSRRKAANTSPALPARQCGFSVVGAGPSTRALLTSFQAGARFCTTSDRASERRLGAAIRDKNGAFRRGEGSMTITAPQTLAPTGASASLAAATRVRWNYIAPTLL